MRKLTLFGVLLAAGSVLPSCSNTSTPDPASNPPTTSTLPTTPKASVSTASSLSDPKGSISYQLELIKAGDADKLKACFTARVREGITKAVVEKAKADASKYTIDDLYASAQPGDSGGKKTNKVKMKNGRTLTTLIETNGEWLADTIWFK